MNALLDNCPTSWRETGERWLTPKLDVGHSTLQRRGIIDATAHIRYCGGRICASQACVSTNGPRKEDCDQLQRLQCHGLIHKKVMLGNYETLGLQWDYNRINHPQISTVDLMNFRVFLSIPFEAPCQTLLLPKPIYSLRVRLTPPASPARHFMIFMWCTFSTTHLKENGLILLRTNENDLSKCL